MSLTTAGCNQTESVLSVSDWSQAAVELELPALAETFEVRRNVAQPYTLQYVERYFLVL